MEHLFEEPEFLEPDPQARRDRDQLSIVEAAYELEPDDRAWLRRLVRALEPSMNQGRGIVGYFDSVNPNRHVMRNMTYVASGTHMLAAAAKAASLMPASALADFLEARPCTTHSEVRGMGPEFADLPEIRDAMWPMAESKDALFLKAWEPDGTCVHFVAVMPEVGRPAPRLRFRLERLSAHIAAARRLRHALLDPASSGNTQDVDAVLDANGKLLHAERAAVAAPARSSLVAAAERQLLARGKLRREDPDRALELWQAMISGRWSLVAQTDSDGKRLLLARRNEPSVVSPRSLTPRERAVVRWTALGHPLTLIAYELGIAQSTASEQRRKALRKLGVRTRAELIRLLASAEEEP